MSAARFITLEGGEGAGKTTQLSRLVEWLARCRGLEAVATREPGGTPGAEAIRRLLVEGAPERWDARTEALLLVAARRDHVRAVVAPGSESIIENLFTAHGDECVRYDAAVDDMPWAELAARLIREGAGTPIAYARADDGAIACNPLGSERVRAAALYLLVKEGCGLEPERVRRIASGG